MKAILNIKNRPGSLHDALLKIAPLGLMRIESFPVKGSYDYSRGCSSEYRFFLEAEKMNIIPELLLVDEFPEIIYE